MPTVPPPVTPSQRVLLGPGPSDVPPRVLSALAAPTIGHLDPEYLKIMDETRAMLREVFRTENELTMAVSGTGSAGMEAVRRQPDRARRRDARLRQRRLRRPDGRRRRAGRRHGPRRSSSTGARSSSPRRSRRRWPNTRVPRSSASSTPRPPPAPTSRSRRSPGSSTRPARCSLVDAVTSPGRRPAGGSTPGGSTRSTAARRSA